jgi:hypothetical protein
MLVLQYLIPDLGKTCIYCITKTGCSICFQDLNAYVKHCLKNHSEFSPYAFDTGIEKFIGLDDVSYQKKLQNC